MLMGERREEILVGSCTDMVAYIHVFKKYVLL